MMLDLDVHRSGPLGLLQKKVTRPACCTQRVGLGDHLLMLGTAFARTTSQTEGAMVTEAAT